jgi:hypothetical protein
MRSAHRTDDSAFAEQKHCFRFQRLARKFRLAATAYVHPIRLPKRILVLERCDHVFPPQWAAYGIVI